MHIGQGLWCHRKLESVEEQRTAGSAYTDYILWRKLKRERNRG